MLIHNFELSGVVKPLCTGFSTVLLPDKELGIIGPDHLGLIQMLFSVYTGLLKRFSEGFCT